MPKPESNRFSTALYDFDAFLDVERNLSPRTRKAYAYDLERFMDACIKRHDGVTPRLDEITTDDIKTYLESLRMNRDYKSTTLSRVIASIRVFFEFCVMRKYVEASPATHIHNPKTPKRLPIYLIESELKRLLAAPSAQAASRGGDERADYEPLAARDYAILVTLGFTGVRLRELVGLNLRSVDFESRTIRVLGKGAKERLIPMNDLVVRALEEWLAVRPLSLTAPDPDRHDAEALFLNRFGRRLSSRGVEKMVSKYVAASGISKDKVSPHKLRHTFATLLHLNGVDILEIQALLGHSTITSTQIYTHVNTSRLKSAVDKIQDI